MTYGPKSEVSSRLCGTKQQLWNSWYIGACERIVAVLEQFKDSKIGREKTKCCRVEKGNGFGEIRQQVASGLYLTQLQKVKEEPKESCGFPQLHLQSR